MLNSDARYLIRIGHQGQFKPPDALAQLAAVRLLLRPLGGQAMNLRVNETALEFDVFYPKAIDPAPLLAALKAIGPLLDCKQLNLPNVKAAPEAIMTTARDLFNQQRYWEAHEVLEELWRATEGSEKQLIQGIILTAAALVHAQKNEIAIVPRMLQDAAHRLKNCPDTYYGLDMAAFVRHLKSAIESKISRFPTI